MKTLYQSLLLVIGALALAGTAFAQVPSSNDTSDADYNSGMGTGSLGGPADFPRGQYNTGSGYQTLYINNGNANTATGYQALLSNTTANYNTAIGYSALYHNRTGGQNTASGYEALYSNTIGNYNTASGYDALQYNTTGENNTATGRGALQSNKTGSNNIAEGYHAGLNLTSGSNNIDIGNEGVAAESGIIRIGTAGTQTATYVAGVTGVVATGTLAPVYVNASGQLSVGPPSAERFKTAIALMGESTARLGELRPVTFQYKSDPHGARQYGLIAEEVAKVYPELVIRDAKGQILTVHYDELAPMLLNEVQKQQIKNAGQEARIRDLEQQVAKMHAALLKLQSKDERVAQR